MKRDFTKEPATPEERKRWTELLIRDAENLSNEDLDWDRMFEEMERKGWAPPQSPASRTGATT